MYERTRAHTHTRSFSSLAFAGSLGDAHAQRSTLNSQLSALGGAGPPASNFLGGVSGLPLTTQSLTVDQHLRRSHTCTLVVDVVEERCNGDSFSLLFGCRCTKLQWLCLRSNNNSKVEGCLAKDMSPQASLPSSSNNGALRMEEGERCAQRRCRAG